MSANDRWPIGVFTSVDAGLGVRLEVAAELGADHPVACSAPRDSDTGSGHCVFVPRSNPWDRAYLCVRWFRWRELRGHSDRRKDRRSGPRRLEPSVCKR